MYFCYALIGQQTTRQVSDSEISQLETEISAARSRLAEVHAMDTLSQTDAYIEKVAREKLGLVLPDETVFVDVTGR